MPVLPKGGGSVVVGTLLMTRCCITIHVDNNFVLLRLNFCFRAFLGPARSFRLIDRFRAAFLAFWPWIVALKTNDQLSYLCT